MQPSRDQPVAAAPSGTEETIDAPHRVEASTVAPGPARVPAQIGPYVIRRVIASGGMGVVYEAMQDHPRRAVALKVMKQGLASRSAVRRFEFESQVLGRLRHPCIAQVYEAGMHDDGSGAGAAPFFVMEYIPAAKTLTEYASMHRLSTRQRLELFALVCDGVHHGHQKGVIHRDLKPANILVDSSGHPKVIDFGVARATDSDLAVTTLQTDVGQLIGTLQYMSPEQIEADPNDLDVRSDVYALGVVLYELLTGALPYDVSDTPVLHATRIIREQSPAPLSKRDHALRGDVETITLKALQKEREARYQSALELAQDIRRYLNAEPISARPPSLVYQIRIFARRNKAAFTAIVSILLVSIAAAVVSSLFARHAMRESEAKSAAMARLQQEADANKAAGDFMREVLALASPQRSLGRQFTVREALDIAAANVTAGTAGQPLAEASARVAVGATYRALGLYEQAAEHLSRAIEIRREHRGADHPETLVIITELASVLGDLNRGDAATEMMRSNLETQQRILGRLHIDTLRTTNALAWLLYGGGDYAEAERLFRESLDGFARTVGIDAPPTLKARTNVAMAMAADGRIDSALPMASAAAADHVRMLGPKNPDTLYARNIEAWTLVTAGRFDDAEPIYREVVAGATEIMGEDHPYRLYWLNSLAWCLLDAGKPADAVPLFEESLRKRSVALAEGHPDTINSELGLLRALVGAGRYEQAEPMGTRAHRAMEVRFGAEATITRSFAAALADLYTGWGRPDQAARYRSRAE